MKRLLVVVSAALLLRADLLPASAKPPAGPVVDVAAETRLLERIKSEIGSAPCTSDDQCRSLPVGAKACGGPAAWWPWSESNADGKRLQAWAQELDRLQRQRFEAIGLQSNCQVVPDPGAGCAAQRCVLRVRGGVV